jgi:DNA-binding FrmR family transcriptional regulator
MRVPADDAFRPCLFPVSNGFSRGRSSRWRWNMSPDCRGDQPMLSIYSVGDYTINVTIHFQRDRRRLGTRVNRIVGQLEAVRLLLDQEGEDEARCYEVMRQLASIKGATRGLMSAYMEGFVRDHVKIAAERDTLDEFAEELLEVVRAFQN